MSSLSLRAFLQGIHHDSEGSGPYAVTLLYWTPTCKWYMAWLVIKIRHQNDMWYNEIGLCARSIGN